MDSVGGDHEITHIIITIQLHDTLSHTNTNNHTHDARMHPFTSTRKKERTQKRNKTEPGESFHMISSTKKLGVYIKGSMKLL